MIFNEIISCTEENDEVYKTRIDQDYGPYHA